MIRFGTAGLRAPVGPGPEQMNVAQVTRVTAGLASWLATENAQQHVIHPVAVGADIGSALSASDGPMRVVVGYDARYGSHTFAYTTAEVFAGAGFEVTLLPTPTPTPIVPWLIRRDKYDAGVQITASHNPAADNGYKVYLASGAQLRSEQAQAVEAFIQAAPDFVDIPRVTVRPSPDPLRRYVDKLVQLTAPKESDKLRVVTERAALKVAYTAMHGVGGRAMNSVLGAAGFAYTYPVVAQQYPDPTFPTVDFPNPEEPGATTALLELGAEVDADLLIALDPDADRCMVGVRDHAGNQRMLSGDELGPLLATLLLPKHEDPSKPAPVVATTVVSSRMLGLVAKERGWDYVETLTGFKNLSNAAVDRPGELAFAYEEAIGTSPFPDMVPDKDGIATALAVCCFAAELKAQGLTLLDLLCDLQKKHGPQLTSQVAVRTANSADLVAQLASEPPTSLVGVAVSAAPIVGDTAVELTGAQDDLSVRLVVRASGTEPKVKLYLQVNAATTAQAATIMEQLRAEVVALLETT